MGIYMFYTTDGQLIKNNIIENFSDIKKELKSYKMITPATLLNFYGKENVAIVNTLKNDFFIVKMPFEKKYLNNYYSEDQFLEMPKKNFDLIVLYCANYTCY